MNDETRIAGLRKVKDWKISKHELLNNQKSSGLWEKVFDQFLHNRIRTRYFYPISAISKLPEKHGKGFSIVAIYCSLIEFFETLKKGYIFKHPYYLNSAGQIVKSAVKKNSKGIYLSLTN